jgi:hypothetical protein
VIVALALFVVSAALVALIVAAPAAVPAVYRPEVETVPPPDTIDHVTAWFVVFATVAVNCTVPLVCTEAVAGVTVTFTGGGGVVTVTVALAVLVVSAALVALIVAVPAVVPAVYRPEIEIVPPPDTTSQVTPVFVVFATVAVNCTVPLV